MLQVKNAWPRRPGCNTRLEGTIVQLEVNKLGWAATEITKKVVRSFEDYEHVLKEGREARPWLEVGEEGRKARSQVEVEEEGREVGPRLEIEEEGRERRETEEAT